MTASSTSSRTSIGAVATTKSSLSLSSSNGGSSASDSTSTSRSSMATSCRNDSKVLWHVRKT